MQVPVKYPRQGLLHHIRVAICELTSNWTVQEQVRAAMVDIKNSELANEIGSITVCGHSLVSIL